ncbi:MAG: hypothetical protein L6264_07415 [Weeksellaceae bacterium]|nr:hypothetical protein [Bacteroidota bacterium]MCG2780762.1 hypothetical protein [Weeksellaceae bacterium]
MIKLTQKPPDLIKMEVQLTIPQTEIFQFLQSKGYEIKAYPIHHEAVEEFLITEPVHIWHTFTATKKDEEQSGDNQFLKVFKKEVKNLLKIC